MNSYVIPAKHLPVLEQLPSDSPSPSATEWINRGTDQRLRPQTVEMLVRTLKARKPSPSVARLHDWAGLRLRFNSMEDRNRFAALIYGALELESGTQ